MQNHQQDDNEITPWLVVVADEGWLYAQTVPLPKPLAGIGLLVYASTWLRPTDTTCRPVLDFLGRSVTEVLIKDVVVDPDMVHGKANLVLHRLVSARHEGLFTQDSSPIIPVFSEQSVARLLDH